MKKYTLILLLIISHLLVGWNFLNNKQDTEPKKVAFHSIKEVNPQSKDFIERKTSLTIGAVGDMLIHSPVYETARTPDGSFDFSEILEKAKPHFEKQDIMFINQETMIGGVEHGLSSYPVFNTPQEFGDEMANMGVDIAALANNHTLDRGEAVVQSALEHWDKLGIEYTGSYKNFDDSERIRVIEENGIEVSFLSYTYGTNGIPVPNGKEYLVNLIDKEKMKVDIEKAKEISDAVVVSMHWGYEYHRMPNQEQKDLAKWLANQGVDIVIGHHPHVLQPFDWVESDDGTHKTFIAYSLGNFLSNQRDLHQKIGGMMEIDIVKRTKGREVSIEVTKPKFLMTYVHDTNWTNHKVYLLKSMPNELLYNKDAIYEEAVSHIKQFIPELIIIEQE